MMTNIALFASGSGSNVENIANYFSNSTSIHIKIILCNKANAGVLDRAKRLNIPALVFSKTELKDGTVKSLMNDHQIDFIVLAGFLLQFPHSLTQAYTNKIINIHPALLPKYGGKGMYGMNVHKAVVSNKETKSGITIHHVNENYDEGAIIFQKECEVLPSDTPADVAQKIHQLEYTYFPQIIDQLINK